MAIVLANSAYLGKPQTLKTIETGYSFVIILQTQCYNEKLFINVNVVISMSLPIIQSLWLGADLTQLEQLSIASFLKNGHQVHLYVYADIQGIPKGTVVKDGNEVLHKKYIYNTPFGYSIFSDWFRYELLYKTGGFFVDLDTICLKPFDFKEEVVFACGSFYAGNRTASSGIIKFPPKDELCQQLIKRCRSPRKVILGSLLRRRKFRTALKALFSSRENMMQYASLGIVGGPLGFDAILKKHKLLHLAQDPHCFYPLTCYQIIDNIFGETYDKNLPPLEQSYAVHIWNSVLRQNNIDKNAEFPESSVFSQLKKKYLN